MIFANGDCYITYQQKDLIADDVRGRIENGFEEKNHVYLTELRSAEHTLTFQYSPLSVMEDHNTIEPGDIVEDEVRAFLREMEFSI